MNIYFRPMTTTRRLTDLGDPSALICAEVVRHTLVRHSDGLRAVVLTGSLARGEGTVTVEGGHSVVLGDAEFLLVFADYAKLPPTQAIARAIHSGLRDVGVVCPITLSPVHADYLRALRPAVFAYELRSCGRVIWGDPHVLHLIPEFPAADIPEEDGWRLLCNRLIEQLEIVPELDRSTVAVSKQDLYPTVKLYLDMATSLLVFTGSYEPTYRGRSQRLTDLAGRDGRSEAYPFQLEHFAEIIALCTRWKLNGGAGPVPEEISWYSAVERARRLWRWELAHMAQASVALPDHELLATLLGRQSVGERARGWLHVLRRLGWHRSWRLWPRWARLVGHGSPRYLIYEAACQTLFGHLEGGLLRPASPAPGDAWGAVWRTLPVVRASGSAATTRPWAEVVAEISWNYREFLVDTRA